MSKSYKGGTYFKLTEYFENLVQVYDRKTVVKVATKVTKETLKPYAEKFNDVLERETPVSAAKEGHAAGHHKNWRESSPGSLKRSIMPLTEYSQNNTRVGYVMGYDGYNHQQPESEHRPFPLIANALNKGWNLYSPKDQVLEEPYVHDVPKGSSVYWEIQAVHQITHAVSTLKGIDPAVEEAIDKALKEREKKYIK